MSTSYTISFATLSGKKLDGTGDTLTAEEFAALSGSNQIADQNFYAIVGDGDGVLEAGETAHKIGDMGYGGRITDVTGNATTDDPVTLTAHGRINNGNIGDLTEKGRFRELGLGLDNGPDGEGTARFLNSGDSLTFTTADALERVTFTASLRGEAGTTRILLDIDGDVLRTADGESAGRAKRSQEVEDALVAIEGVAHGDHVTIDYGAQTITVVSATTGEVRTVDGAALFAAHDTGEGRAITIGSRNGTAVALDDLQLTVTDTFDPDSLQAVDDTVSYNSAALFDTDFRAFDNDINLSLIPFNDVTVTLNVEGIEYTGGLDSDVETTIGTFTIGDDRSALVFAPRDGFAGNFSFTYTLDDGEGGFNPSTATVTVTDTAPPAPLTADDDEFFLFGTSGQINTVGFDVFVNDDLGGRLRSEIEFAISEDGGNTFTTLDTGEETLLDGGRSTLLRTEDGSLRYEFGDESDNPGFHYRIDDGVGGADPAFANVTFTGGVITPTPSDDGTIV